MEEVSAYSSEDPLALLASLVQQNQYDLLVLCTLLALGLDLLVEGATQNVQFLHQPSFLVKSCLF